MSETTIERSAMYEQGRKDADRGYATMHPRDEEYMAGYTSSDVVLEVLGPIDEKTPIQFEVRPQDACNIFRALAMLTQINPDPLQQGRVMETWHRLADATLQQGYGSTAEEMAAKHDEMTPDSVREQFGLDVAGLPVWYFQIRSAVKEAFAKSEDVALAV